MTENNETALSTAMLTLFDRAVAEELPRISTLQFNSHLICTVFAENLRKRLLAMVPSQVVLDDEQHQMLLMQARCLDEWLKKTDWVQEQMASFPFLVLGQHRADVMRQEIERLRAELQRTQEARELVEAIASTCHEMKVSFNRDGTLRQIRMVLKATTETSPGYRQQVRKQLRELVPFTNAANAATH